MAPRKKVAKKKVSKRTARKAPAKRKEPTIDELLCTVFSAIEEAEEVVDCLQSRLCNSQFIRLIKGNGLAVHTYSGYISNLRKVAKSLKKEANDLLNQKKLACVGDVYKSSILDNIERLNKNVKLAKESLLDDFISL